MFVFYSWVNEYTQRDDWLSYNSEELPKVTWFWVRIGFSLIMGIVMPFWICTSETCPTLWRNSKQPQNHVPETFPHVTYRPQATVSPKLIIFSDLVLKTFIFFLHFREKIIL